MKDTPTDKAEAETEIRAIQTEAEKRDART